jgi:hypothetical protein
VPEVATRIVKQLVKIAKMLAIVWDKPEVDGEVYRVVRKVGFDSCVGFHLDIVLYMVRENREVTAKEMSERLGLPSGLVNNRIQDMLQLNIIAKSRDDRNPAGVKGATPWKYRVMESIKDLWTRSRLSLRQMVD